MESKSVKINMVMVVAAGHKQQRSSSFNIMMQRIRTGSKCNAEFCLLSVIMPFMGRNMVVRTTIS